MLEVCSILIIFCLQTLYVDRITLFFDEEMEMEKMVCRENICTSREKELSNKINIW